MRSSERKRARNRSVKSRLKTLERGYLATLDQGGQEEAAGALRNVTSALDKAAKSGVIHKGRADRKKSRLAVKLGKSA